MERIKVNLDKARSNSYEIFVGEESLDRMAPVINMRTAIDRYVIITDSNVNPHYGQGVCDKLKATGLPVHILEFPAGESSKTLDTVHRLTRELVRLGASRKTLLVALGGGVVGDVAGFVASIYMRSVPFVQIPTTLLAQVDSSVGGKTGVDLPEGKNLVGSFYQPEAVFIDLSFLETLSDRDFKNGIAEIIKYGVIQDAELFEILESEYDAVRQRKTSLIQNLVGRSCKIKALIVEQDERESGLRRILNFGHTLGHAIEAASAFTFSHGEAIAVGMVGAAKISCKLQHLARAAHDRIVGVIEQYGLPIGIPKAFDTSKIPAFLASDKKAVGAKIHFVLARQIGRVFVSSEVPPALIHEVLEELAQ